MSLDDFFMGIAFVVGQRSKDKEIQVGACVVNKTGKKIVGVGWNGMPTGLHDDLMPWGKHGETDSLEDQKLYVCHAAVNAVLYSVTADLEDCKIYTTLLPCNSCAKYLVQAGIKEVVYFSEETPETTVEKPPQKKGTKPSETKEYTAAMEIFGENIRPHNPVKDILGNLKKRYTEMYGCVEKKRSSSSSGSSAGSRGAGDE